MANRYVLSHDDVEISYTIGETPGLEAFTYTDGNETKKFKQNEITTDPTQVGTMVTVALEPTIDAGGVTLSVLLPFVRTTMGHPVHVSSFAVYRTTRGPVVLPQQQTVSYRTMHLHGTAEEVIVPLLAATAA